MRELLSWLVIVNGLIVAIYLLREKSIGLGGFAGLVAGCILAGTVLANLANITQMMISAGEGRSFNVQMQRVETRAQEVETVAAEVKAAQESIQLLVANANATNATVETSEKKVTELAKQTTSAATAVQAVEASVTETRRDIRHMLASIFQSFAYAIGTRNLFPPPQFVGTEIDRHLNILAAFAYPDPKERAAEIQKLMAALKKAQPGGPAK